MDINIINLSNLSTLTLTYDQNKLINDLLITYKKHVRNPDIFVHDIIFLYYDDLVLLQKILDIFVLLKIDMNICNHENQNIIHKLVLFMDEKNKKNILSCIHILIKYKIDYNKRDIYNKTPGDYERYMAKYHIRSRL
jgi:hypothetical protein